MLLAVDVGNTHTVFALCSDNKIEDSWRFTTDHQRTEDEYASQLLYLMREQGHSSESVKGAVISSVVPDALFPLRQCCKKYFDCDPFILGRSELDIGMNVKIDRPDELGADRLVNAVAAWQEYQRSLIVIDFGTATTFDVVNGNGDYVGGLIAPGVMLSLEALQQAAAQLHGITVKRPEKVVGTNTTTAMQSGVYYGYLGLIEGIVSRIKQEHDADMPVIATGGLAPLYSESSDLIDKVDPELTMRGLQLIYQRNVTPS